MTRFRSSFAALVLALPLLAGCVPGFFGTQVPPPAPAKKHPAPSESALAVATPKSRPDPARPRTAPAPQAAPQVPVEGAPVEEARLAQPPAGRRGVIGHSEDETEILLGKPVRVTEQASAKVWRYQSDDCAVDVTFFFDVSRGRFFALDVTPVTGDVARCLSKLEDHVAS